MILIDTNVVLDVLAKRDPFYAPAALLWSSVERGETDAAVSAISFNNTYYILRRHGGENKARTAVRAMRSLFAVVPLDAQILGLAIDSPLRDFEDAIQLHSAARAGASHLVTRDPDGFPATSVTIVTPEEYLAVFRATEGA